MGNNTADKLSRQSEQTALSSDSSDCVTVLGDLGEYRALIELVCETALGIVPETAQCGGKYEVSVAFVSEYEIRRLNRDYRSRDAVTDVLSFESDGVVNPENGRRMLGDVALCLERAAAQAETYGHDLRREVAFLTAHSLLHLLGYDHAEAETTGEIFALQEKILERAGIVR